MRLVALIGPWERLDEACDIKCHIFKPIFKNAKNPKSKYRGKPKKPRQIQFPVSPSVSLYFLSLSRYLFLFYVSISPSFFLSVSSYFKSGHLVPWFTFVINLFCRCRHFKNLEENFQSSISFVISCVHLLVGIDDLKSSFTDFIFSQQSLNIIEREFIGLILLQML